MLFQYFEWDLTHQRHFFTFCPAIIWTWLERPALKMDILWCKTDICSCKLSAEVSLMLGNPFLVPSPVQSSSSSSSIFSSRLAQKSPANSLFPSRKLIFFWSDPRCFGLLGKFQHNIEISIKMTCVSRLAVSCNCVLTCKIQV